MTDTPKYIKDMQLKIWLSKSPAGRLKQFLSDNEVLLQFFEKAKKSGQLNLYKANEKN